MRVGRGAAVQRRERRTRPRQTMMRLAARLRAAGRRRRHHVHLDHDVLPPGHGGGAGDVDAAGPLPRARPDPTGAGRPDRRAGRARRARTSRRRPRRWRRRSARRTRTRGGWRPRAGRGWPRRSRCCSARAPITAVAAFVVTALIDRLGRLLNRWGLAGVLPAGRRRAGRHGGHAGAVRRRGVPAGHPAVAGGRGEHHGAAVGAVGGRHRAGRDLQLLRHGRRAGSRRSRCSRRAC